MRAAAEVANLFVSTHSHPKVAGGSGRQDNNLKPVSTHSHPKVAGSNTSLTFPACSVSTHSHPKVAGWPPKWVAFGYDSFNTQPPEGGWIRKIGRQSFKTCFNTQPPEGGLLHTGHRVGHGLFQHTATRRWLGITQSILINIICFNTQPPEGGCSYRPSWIFLLVVSTHSHPKVAGVYVEEMCRNTWFQHTATRRWLPDCANGYRHTMRFQHTATRRWLLPRPAIRRSLLCFNTQPPEGGCSSSSSFCRAASSFNTQPPEGGWSLI